MLAFVHLGNRLPTIFACSRWLWLAIFGDWFEIFRGHLEVFLVQLFPIPRRLLCPCDAFKWNRYLHELLFDTKHANRSSITVVFKAPAIFPKTCPSMSLSLHSRWNGSPLPTSDENGPTFALHVKRIASIEVKRVPPFHRNYF